MYCYKRENGCCGSCSYRLDDPVVLSACRLEELLDVIQKLLKVSNSNSECVCISKSIIYCSGTLDIISIADHPAYANYSAIVIAGYIVQKWLIYNKSTDSKSINKAGELLGIIDVTYSSAALSTTLNVLKRSFCTWSPVDLPSSYAATGTNIYNGRYSNYPPKCHNRGRCSSGSSTE